MGVVVCDVLRDVRHSSARAARDLADWLAALELEGKADRTRYHYALTGLDLVEAWPDKSIAEFTDGDLSHLLRGYPPAGRDTRRAHLQSLMSWAKRTRRITENPLDYLVKAKKRKPRLPDVFSDAELALFYGLASPDGELMTLAGETGLRKSECRHLERRHVNLRLGRPSELVVYAGKGDKDRIVPLTSLAVQAVSDLDDLERLNPSDFLWYSKPGGTKRLDHSRAIADGTFARWWTRCVDASGVTYRKPHMLRHTFATSWRRKGLDLDELQLLLGHASIRTTSDLYVHTTIHDVAARMAQIEAGIS